MPRSLCDGRNIPFVILGPGPRIHTATLTEECGIVGLAAYSAAACAEFDPI